jgi:predicted acylesterase/phospholipase RssA
MALVFQSGGALGAGVYEALAESSIHPDWIAGISIGGINAAIIAGNPPNMRVDRLREFWTQVTSDAPWHWLGWGIRILFRARTSCGPVAVSCRAIIGFQQHPLKRPFPTA